MTAQSITKTTQEPARYTYRHAGTIQAKYRDVRGQSGRLVTVRNETTGARYTVIVTEKGRVLCSCPHYRHRLSGTLHACKHGKGALQFLAQEDAREAAVMAGIERTIRERDLLWG